MSKDASYQEYCPSCFKPKADNLPGKCDKCKNEESKRIVFFSETRVSSFGKVVFDENELLEWYI